MVYFISEPSFDPLGLSTHLALGKGVQQLGQYIVCLVLVKWQAR